MKEMLLGFFACMLRALADNKPFLATYPEYPLVASGKIAGRVRMGVSWRKIGRGANFNKRKARM